jgi:hypothetical protein
LVTFCGAEVDEEQLKDSEMLQFGPAAILSAGPAKTGERDSIWNAFSRASRGWDWSSSKPSLENSGWGFRFRVNEISPFELGEAALEPCSQTPHESRAVECLDPGARKIQEINVKSIAPIPTHGQLSVIPRVGPSASIQAGARQMLKRTDSKHFLRFDGSGI